MVPLKIRAAGSPECEASLLLSRFGLQSVSALDSVRLILSNQFQLLVAHFLLSAWTIVVKHLKRKSLAELATC